MTEVKPALTAEEWAVGGTNNGEVAVTASPDVCVHGEGQSICVDADLRHALAALALHNQPFGFTREDVDLLRCEERRFMKQAQEFEDNPPYAPLGETKEKRMGIAQYQRGLAAVYRSLADRIEALLPPS